MTNFENKEKNLFICLHGKKNYYFGINFISVGSFVQKCC